MRLKSRIQGVEKRFMGGSAPTIVYFRTFYENPDGSVGSETRRATIIAKGRQSALMESDDVESIEEFKQRVEAECIRLHGRAPIGHNDS